jgi:hypothetical protein
MSVDERCGTGFEQFVRQNMVAGDQKYTVVEESCTGSRRLTQDRSITDNYVDAIIHSNHYIYCNTRVSYTVTDDLNA